jgi:pyruvate dehydrogenase E1 component beta subunit
MTTTTMTMAKALNEGIRAAMTDDAKTLLIGEDIGQLGGVFRITDGLQKEFGENRVIDALLAESAIVGTSVGMAIRGYKPCVEIQFDGFVYPAFDQIVSQVAKLHKRSDGVYTMNMVIRIPFQGGIGAIEHHSESPESYFAHTPGLRVVSPSTPNDAYWMIRQSMAHPDPIIFCEPKSRYWEKGEVNLDEAPQGLFTSALRGEGTDVTVVTYGSMVKTSLRARDTAAVEGRSLEVFDLRSLSPVDYEPLVASVEKTGRLLVVHEAPATASIGASVIAELTKRCFYSMKAPGLVIAGYHVPYPISRLEDEYRPNVDRILDGVDQVMGY